LLRDIDVLLRVSEHNRLFVNITITTLDVHLARILEPRAPRPDLRLDAVRQLNQSGVHAGVICAPVLPEITDRARDLENLVRATAEAGGKYIYANPLFLKPCSAAVFIPFLQKEFPSLVDNYRRRFESHAFVSSAYHKRISDLMAKLRVKYGFTNNYERYSRRIHAPALPDQEQLSLF
jgi:DNA repair photolyase